MKFFLLTLASSIALFILLFFSSFNNLLSNTTQKSEAQSNFEAYCANCHGLKMERFTGRTWEYGNSNEEMIKTIRDGRPEIGMPSFGEAFTFVQMEAISEYIRTEIKNDKSKPKLTQYPDIVHSKDLSFKLDTVATGLSGPWGMVILPDGDLLVTEKSGQIFRFRNGILTSIIEGIPNLYVRGQGGLMDIKLHPDYKKNGWIYITYAEKASEEDGDDGGCTALIRCKLENNQLVEIEKLFRAYPNSKRGVHFGSRMVFDESGHLFLTVGERGNRPNAQNLSNHCGKVHRINDDGSIPKDNPFFDTPNAIKSIWTYGHRNPQGIDINPLNNQVWTNEHGPKGGDEINILDKGKNYGWPEITFGINYNGTIITEDTAKAGLEQPLHYWIPSIAPSSMIFVKGNRYPAWKGDVLSGSLSFKYLERSIIKNNKVVGREKLLENAGRIRNVIMGSDGYIYVAAEYPGIIVKIVPVDEK